LLPFETQVVPRKPNEAFNSFPVAAGRGRRRALALRRRAFNSFPVAAGDVEWAAQIMPSILSILSQLLPGRSPSGAAPSAPALSILSQLLLCRRSGGLRPFTAHALARLSILSQLLRVGGGAGEALRPPALSILSQLLLAPRTAAKSALALFQFFPSCCRSSAPARAPRRSRGLSILSQLLRITTEWVPVWRTADFQFFPSCCRALSA